MPSWPGRPPVTEPARANLPWIFGPRDTDTAPGPDTDTRADAGIGPQGDADTDTQADTRPGPQTDTGETVSPAEPGIATLAIPAADDAPLPLGARLAARYSELPGWAQDLLWPFIRLVRDAYNGQPDSMRDYRRYAQSGEWVHPVLDGRGRKISFWLGRAYHALWGQWVHKLGLSLAYCGPRPLRFLGWLAFAAPFLVVFAVFARLI